MHYAKIHFGDYARDTGHLTLLENGAYLQLIRIYYTTERPLTLDMAKLYRSVSARTPEEQAAVSSVLEDFFTSCQDGWHQKRIDAEIDRYHENALKNQANGMLGGRPREPKENPQITQSVPVGNPQITLTTNHEPLTTNHNKKPPPKPPGELDGFSRFWKAWPPSSRKESRKACLKRWSDAGYEKDADKIIAHVLAKRGCEQWRDEKFIPAPLVYLNQARWDGAEIADDPFKGVICG